MEGLGPPSFSQYIIMIKQDKALVKLSEKHNKLTKGLKDSLLLTQFGWLKAGKYLYEIREKKTYRAEDSSREITFAEFCERPDILLPGRKDASRLRIAQMLIHIHKFWILEKRFTPDQLVSAGYSKLDMLVPVVQKQGDAEGWLNKALMLTTDDLVKEIRQGDKTLESILDCKHKNIEKITFWKCADCHTTWKNDPDKKAPIKKNKK